jgi:arylsulfatase A
MRGTWFLRRVLALAALALGVTAAPTVAAAEAADPPNIVLLLADDAGVETVGAYGGEYATPRLDAMASQGIRFDNAHATPLCTPSRVRLLTGRYSFRNYKAFGHLDPRETTIAQVLRRAGYRTAAVGKWQLGGNPLDGVPGSSPGQAGFDEWRLWAAGRDFLNDGCQHWDPTLDTNGHRQTHKGEFGSDLIQRYALDFIDRNAQRPFFLYYSMILPHDPWVATPATLDASTREQMFAAMVEYLDMQVGELLDRLDNKGLRSRTLVIFVADNGSHVQIRSRWKGSVLAGGKGTTLDSGTHVPLLLRWPGRIAASGASPQIVDLTDLYATIAAAAGQSAAAAASDGFDLVGALTGSPVPRREAIFMDFANGWWPFDPRRYAFVPRWKLYSDGRLFDVDADPREQTPLAAAAATPEANAVRQRLESLLLRMGEHAVTPQDAHFPRGFDPEKIDYAAVSRRLAERIAECGDPSRAPRPPVRALREGRVQDNEAMQKPQASSASPAVP